MRADRLLSLLMLLQARGRMTAQELEQGVQQTYENLFHFFKQRAPKQILKWLPFFIRHPRILVLVWQALHRRIKIVGG